MCRTADSRSSRSRGLRGGAKRVVLAHLTRADQCRVVIRMEGNKLNNPQGNQHELRDIIIFIIVMVAIIAGFTVLGSLYFGTGVLEFGALCFGQW